MKDKTPLNRDERAALILKCFEEGVQYQSEMGFTKAFPKYVDFYEGRQWPKATARTRNMPRPVVNFTKMICRNKISAILSVPAKIVYRAENDSPEVLKYNRAAAYVQKEMKLDALDKEAIRNGAIKGSYAYHFYWDACAVGLDASVKGALRCEVLDPLRVFYADPTCRDEQKQRWILVATREDLESVREKADEDVRREDILADENSENYYGEHEQGKDKLCTVLTRYFRRGGKVYWERATKRMLINAARPLKPDAAAVLIEMEGNEEDTRPESDVDGGEFELYPIVSGSYEPREGSIYGIGEVEGIIPNQKAVNLHLGMTLFNAQQLAWGKYIVMPNALQGQRINNEPGQVLVDYSKTGQGIKKMTEQTLHSQPMDIVNVLMQLTRSATGATELMTGETVGSNMSGAAIAALQAQAQQPVEELRDTFWQVKIKQGLVIAQFLKQYYVEYPFTYTEKAADGSNQTLTDSFNGAEFTNMRFDVVAEAMKGSKSSIAGDINALDTLFAKNLIDVEGYINAYPEEALSNKTELLEVVRSIREGENAQLRAQLEEASAAMQQLQEQLAQKEQTVQSVEQIVGENGKLREQFATLYSQFIALRNEATQKINMANELIQKQARDGLEVAADAREFAAALAEREGVLPQ